MKIYTKKGDRGDTSLFGGRRVSKSSCRIDVYGTVDELNSIIGLARSYDLSKQGDQLLGTIQHNLFTIGADLATPNDDSKATDRITSEETAYLEEAIDQLEEELPPLKNFIFPGGSTPGATLHVARTVCRRAERSYVKCGERENLNEEVLKYLNRLSDLLFVLARYENRQNNVKEHQWKQS